MGCLHQISPLRAQETGSSKSGRAEGIEDTKQIRPLIQDNQYILNQETLAACVDPAQDCTIWDPRTDKSGHMP